MIDAIGNGGGGGGGGGPDVAGLYEAARGADEGKRLKELEGQGRKEAARQMEAFFVQTLLKEMRQTLPEGGFFGKGPGTHVFQGMFEQMLAEDIARGEGVGLRQFILDSLPPEGVAPGEVAKAAAADAVAGGSPETDDTSETLTQKPEPTEGRDAR